MEYTTHLNLKKPETTDTADVADVNDNMDAIDEAIHDLDTAAMKNTGAQSMSGALSITDTTESSSTSTGALKVSGGIGCAKNIRANKVYNAVWNDYAECREVETLEAGRCVFETGGAMKKTTNRLMAGCRITSDTFGYCMGETAKAKTPIAVAGRVLAHPYRDKAEYPLGAAVCSGPDGTVDLMNREEIQQWPDRIIGYVSEIPTYKTWNCGTEEDPQEVDVNGRIWIYVR